LEGRGDLLVAAAEREQVRLERPDVGEVVEGDELISIVTARSSTRSRSLGVIGSYSR